MNSVHLQKYPNVNVNINSNLINHIAKVRDICSLALSIRKAENIKVRIPLNSINLYGNLDFIEQYTHLIKDEINVKNININNDISIIGKEFLQINFKTLGPKVGKDIQKIIVAQKSQEYKNLPNGNIKIAGIEVEKNDFTLTFQAKDGINARFSEIAKCGITLDLNLTPELIAEGIMRDIIRAIQQERKRLNLNISQRIKLSFNTKSENIKASIYKFESHILSQCLITEIIFDEHLTIGIDSQINDESFLFQII